MALSDLPEDPDVLLALAPEELGFALLRVARRETQNGIFHPANIPYPARSTSLQPPVANRIRPGQEGEVERALAEGWNWLRVQGLIVPAPGPNGANGWMVLSRFAEKMVTESAFTQFRQTAAFPKSLLHPLIAEKTWLFLARNELDEAVFHAFRTVEELVRTAGGFTSTDVGVTLVRKAFNPAGGPLTDMGQPEAEREALSNLFAGAIGSYKNPHSHRTVSLNDPNEAQEMVILASHLLRIIETRQKDIGKLGTP